MFDGLNEKESMEVMKIRDQCIKLNYNQTWSLAKMLLNDLNRGIYYIAKERDEFKEKNVKLKEKLKSTKKEHEEFIKVYLEKMKKMNNELKNEPKPYLYCKDCGEKIYLAEFPEYKGMTFHVGKCPKCGGTNI